MADGVRRNVRRAARLLGVERQALAFRRAFLPPHVRADIRDHALIVALMERVLTPDSDCLDVGAHEGLFLSEMVRLAPRGRHIAWEPLPDFAEELRLRYPTAKVREAALSDQAGSAEYTRVLESPGWSGFRARPEGGARVETITVRSERLDDVLSEEIAPAFIKIDVEGAEEGVIRGGLRTLRRFLPVIVFEHGSAARQLYGTTPEKMHELVVDELGYEIRPLDDDGAFSAAQFADQVTSGERYNFAAHPR